MRGYILVPESVSCNACKYCGARPIIALVEVGEYVVKCPNSNSHYHTEPGLIDIEDWNLHNIPSVSNQVDVAPNKAGLDHFFHLNGAIISLSNAE
ncbi:MAG TPA: hypothetical protein VJ844_00675 [Mucilaginibacter sp.]|nr:hypothetical protein [Mucilaginibacter sp.]